MKVILLQDVSKVGRRFSIVEVPHGFALNKLIPQGLAEEATPANVKRITTRTARIATETEESQAAFQEAVARLKDMTVNIPASANESGHLFEALKADRIAAAFAEAGAAIKASQISFDIPIKSLGEHTVQLSSGGETTDITVNVVQK